MIKPEHVPLKVIHALVMNLHKPWPDAIAAALNAWPDIVDTHLNNIGHLVLQFKLKQNWIG